MTRVSIPARTAADWRPLLAEPDLHWRSDRAAPALARAWQDAALSAPDGLPREVRAALATYPAFARLDALLVIPQRVTALPGAGVRSDALVLARAADGLATIAVEGATVEATAAGPAFGPTVGAWRADPTPTQAARLAPLLEVLGLDAVPDLIRIGLVERSAAALVEADAFAATHAVVLVHAFARASRADAAASASFDDLAAFVAVFGTQLEPGTLVTVPRGGGRWLHFAWAQGTLAPGDPPSADALLRDQLSAILGGPVESAASTLLSYGDPVEVLVRADLHTVHVEVPVVEWRGTTRVLTGERRASFPREAVTRLGGEAPFIHAVLAARAERVARFRVCAACGERTAPEMMQGTTICARCAGRHLRADY